MLALVLASGRVFAVEQPDKAPVDFTEIGLYADFANASYRPVSEIRELAVSRNYTLTHYSNMPETGIAYYLLNNDVARTQLIAVRGTSNVENAMVDVALKLTADKHAGVHLHAGFSLTAQAVYEEIKPLLKPGYVINATGHSLGGAVAVILAMYLDVDNFEAGRVVTFGQPKVTNMTGSSQFQQLDIIRVVMPKDVVPLVPPFDPVDINDVDIYWHLGREVILLPDNTYAVLEGVNSMLRAAKFTQDALTENNINHHMMSAYLELLDEKIPTARQVPFKISLNLFNLFGSEQQ